MKNLLTIILMVTLGITFTTSCKKDNLKESEDFKITLSKDRGEWIVTDFTSNPEGVFFEGNMDGIRFIYVNEEFRADTYMEGSPVIRFSNQELNSKNGTHFDFGYFKIEKIDRNTIKIVELFRPTSDEVYEFTYILKRKS